MHARSGVLQHNLNKQRALRMIANFFINRPIFASVIAIVIMLAGLISIYLLPVGEFPQVVPPTVNVSTTYPGASAEVVEKSVTTPLEEQINGVEGMVYISSTSSDSGDSNIVVTFEEGYDLDIAAVEVRNRVAIAQAQLPDDVVRQGITVSKQSSELTLGINLISPDGTFDDLFISNYAEIHITNALKRIPGVGSITVWGERVYAMRIWLDPEKLGNLGITTGDVFDAVSQQNIQVAAGSLGEPPAPKTQKFQYTLTTQGRLKTVEQFGNIIVRAGAQTSVVRLKDIARIELGAEDYSSVAAINGQPTVGLGVMQLPGANALDLSASVRSIMERLSKDFPKGLEYSIVYDTTNFDRAAIKEVLFTLIQAILLVVFVIIVFLQSFRATLIPAITIPVCLIGTFALMYAWGFSINLLTLFGLVLAVGLVVDDAIVVVENVSRHMEEGETDPKRAARLAMEQVTGPIIATSLVLMAVFIPVAFIPGIAGKLYQQFALTIASAVAISTLNALTLSPALCALLLDGKKKNKNRLSAGFERGFKSLTARYERAVGVFGKHWAPVSVVFFGLLAATWYMFTVVPTGFIPNEDQGYFIVSMHTPEGTSLSETEKSTAKIHEVLSAEAGVKAVVQFTGFDFLTNTSAPNVGTLFPVLKNWDERKGKDENVTDIMGRVQAKFAAIPGVTAVALNPPPIFGLSPTGGFQFELQDYVGGSLQVLEEVANELVKDGNAMPQLNGLFSQFSASTPQRYIDLDRDKAITEGIPIDDVFNALQTYLGSMYVNDFNLYGRVYQVYLQAEAGARDTSEDIGKIYVRNKGGEMVPLDGLINVERRVGARTINHYNLFRSVAINGGPNTGYSSGQAITAMEQLAETVLPNNFGYEWTGNAFQEIKAGNEAPIVFALALMFAFLFMAAQYESWSMPLMVLLAVPLAILGALLAQWLRGLDNDIYCQVGLVMLIGLASKSAILLVEFARRRRLQGLSVVVAAQEAARIRLRPIIMTAFAFIFGVLPLVIATGAGASARHSLGTAVFGGMIVATLLSLVFVPVLYIVIERLREGRVSPSPAKPEG